MKNVRFLWGIVFALVTTIAVLAIVGRGRAAPDAALGTTFTYQGRLELSGALVNDACDFQFSLWDAAVGGGQIGSTQMKSGVTVSKGLFTVQLDFGAGPFAGDGRWLAISVRCPAGSGIYTDLSPRQPLTAVPYALNARSSPWSGLSGVPAGFADGVDNDTTTFWSLTGNSGTTPGTNFIGTTDNKQLTIGVNGAAALRLEANPSGPNLIGGYSGNSVSANVAGAVIGGGGSSGIPNRITDNFSVVGGGYNNQAGDNAGDQQDAPYAFVGGGGSNTASSDYAAIVGGWGNTASKDFAAIGGGESNTASADWSAIGGGRYNNTSGYASVIAGGTNNTASGDRAIVSGGYNNSASNTYATISGGNNNTANASNTTIGGGWANQAVNPYGTIPGGTKARTGHYGEWAYASGEFADIGDAQTSLYVLRNTTTDATPTPLFLDGATVRLTIAQNRAVAFDILVVASGPTGGNIAGYQIQGLVQNFNGGMYFVGTPAVTILGEDNAAWNAAVAANDTVDALDILVTGVAGVTIRWVASVRTVEVLFP